MKNILILTLSLLLLCFVVTDIHAQKPAERKPAKADRAVIKAVRKTIDKKDQRFHVLILTGQGDILVRLFNETPLHRDNFVAKVKEGFYDSLMFHRVIKDFMIQGGDPNSRKPTPGQQLGAGSAPGDRIPAEFRTEQNIYHKRGALAAARDGNPQKASSNCQFYLVQRKPWRATELDSMVRFRGLRINEKQKELYVKEGGTPHLDGGYTVFGETVSGLDVIDRIATVKTGPADRPVADVRMRMYIVHEPTKK